MYAIIETGGKQYKVEAGDVIYIEKLNAEADSEVTFDEVLAVGSEDGIKTGGISEYVSSVMKNNTYSKLIKLKESAGERYWQNRIVSELLYLYNLASMKDTAALTEICAVSDSLFTQYEENESISPEDVKKSGSGIIKVFRFCKIHDRPPRRPRPP